MRAASFSCRALARTRRSSYTLGVSRFILLPCLLLAPTLAAQSRDSLIVAARARTALADYDSADALLHAALDSTTPPGPTFSQQASALFWQGIVHFSRGNDSLARLSIRAALRLNPNITMEGLGESAPRLAAILDEEHKARGPVGVYVSSDVDVKPQRTGGPAVQYPAALARRHVDGLALLAAVIDTFGRAEPVSIDVLKVPDSALIAPLREMILASTYSPGRRRGQAVRTLIEFQITLHAPPPPDATALITRARAELAAGRTGAALRLLGDALDPATHATDGERMYGLLVRGIAESRQGRDSAAQADAAAAEQLQRELTSRHIPLAPFLLTLADSVRHGLHAANASAAADETIPQLLSRPAATYPAEMRALNVTGTVTVEATVDTTGRVIAAKVIRSPNPGLDAEALRVVRESRYRPAYRNGRPVQATTRAGVTFVAH